MPLVNNIIALALELFMYSDIIYTPALHPTEAPTASLTYHCI